MDTGHLIDGPHCAIVMKPVILAQDDAARYAWHQEACPRPSYPRAMNNPQPPFEINEFSPDRPTKTQRKKAAHDLQKLGLKLVTLSERQLKALPMNESLREALIQDKTIRSHEGRRRHRQLIGKLMRQVDAGPLEEAVAQAELRPAKAALELHKAECWRSKLIAHDDALTHWVQAYPGTNVQTLRMLIRAARQDAGMTPEQRSRKAFRQLFQFIKSHDSEGPQDATEDGNNQE